MVIYTKLKTATDWGTAKSSVNSTTGSYSGVVELTGHADTSSYDVKIVFYDEFTSGNPSTATLSVGTAIVPMSWSRSGIGAGKVWEQGALDVGGDAFISGNLTLTGTGGNVYTTSKKPTPAEIGAEAVTVTGSNANGYYIKFADGTMICYGRKPLNTLAMTWAWGAFYTSSDITTSYPVSFVGQPASVSVNMENTTADIAVWLNGLSSNTSFTGYFSRGQSGTFNCTMAWMAVGRWK